MTTIAPNLGRAFNGTARPATDEDIAILAPSDWIKEKDDPWCYRFKLLDGDMCIGVWEGKEFLIPRHLLMVVEVLEYQLCEKFFRKPEPKFKVGDDLQPTIGDRILPSNTHTQQFKVGDRVIAYKGKPAASAVIHDARIENGRIQIIWDDVQDKSPRWFAVDVLTLEQDTDLSFKKSITSFSVGDRFSVCPGVNNECEIIELSGSKYRVRWSLNGDEQVVEAAFLAGLKPVQPEKLFTNEDDGEYWNPADFGELPHQLDADGQATIFYDDSNEPPDPDDFKTIEEFEEAWKKWENLPQEYCSPVAEAVRKVQLPQDTKSSGQLKTIATPQPSTASDSQESYLSSKTLPPLATNLSEVSQLQTSLSVEVLAKIFPLQAIAPGLKELAANCFLNSSDSWKSSSLRLYCGSKFQQSCQVEEGKTSSKSLMRLQKWGMWGIGKLGTEADTFPKTESDYSVWVFTGDIRATEPDIKKKTLAEIIGEGNAIVYRAADGDRIYTEIAPTLRSLANTGNHQAGSGAYKIREYNGETYLERPINATEAEQLMGWEVGSTATGINIEGDEVSISQTQRIKMIGNGVIPAEITDILSAIKPMLERKLESEVSEHLQFAYRQLRQKNYTHQEAVSILDFSPNLIN